MITIICGTMGGAAKESLISAMLFKAVDEGAINFKVDLNEVAVIEGFYSGIATVLQSVPVPLGTNLMIVKDGDTQIMDYLFSRNERSILYAHEAVWDRLVTAVSKHKSGEVKFMIPVGTSRYYENRAISSVNLLLDSGAAQASEIILVPSFIEKDVNRYDYPFSDIKYLLTEKPGITVSSLVLMDTMDANICRVKDFLLANEDDVLPAKAKLTIYCAFDKLIEYIDERTHHTSILVNSVKLAELLRDDLPVLSIMEGKESSLAQVHE